MLQELGIRHRTRSRAKNYNKEVILLHQAFCDCCSTIEGESELSRNKHRTIYQPHILYLHIGSEQGTTFPTKMGTTVCNALIHTGATWCCISDEYYRKLQLTKIHLLQNVNVRSATGSNLAPIGLVNCAFVLGDTIFNCDFIVCKNLSRPLILGRDFLIQNTFL